MERRCRVSGALAGQRLDHALAVLLPDMGLRGRRRCIAQGRVLLNGRRRPAACRLHADDEILFLDEAAKTAGDSGAEPAGRSQNAAEDRRAWAGAFPADLPRLLARQGEYCFLYKPALLHSVALAGSRQPSLEAHLPRLLPGQAAAARLLQRLDYGTSGIVCAALSEDAAKAFRRAEAAGHCEKRYLALLDGIVPGPLTARQALGTDGRRKTRVRADAGDTLRWTEFWPLHCWQGVEAARLLAGLRSGAAGPEPAADTVRGLTLAACRIRRGARHQIRAHAAALGYPLWGDALYGAGQGGDPGPKSAAHAGAVFFLHHGALRLPAAACLLMPAWALPAPVAEIARKWLESSTFCGILKRGPGAALP
ncbi:RNA pseudouridine synthase [Desulfovibrio sp. ZJ200]|uniref:pseudouridine synthase family protein n=1 Tax=Desulfovibrio sp. ZJ200 TaxID=2709792 RepID=UPI0013EA85EA|nr:RNA pseudouridine synthase [Desulfovibrio sp. ZJ200]